MGRWTWATLLVMLIAACDDTAETGGVGTIAVQELPAALATSWCAATQACCGTDTSDLAACEAAAALRVQEMLDGMGPLQAYDGEAAGACVAALDALPATCDEAQEAAQAYLAACSPVISGTLAPGEPCASVEDCRPEPGMRGSFATGFVGCLPYGGQEAPRCRVFRSASDVGQTCAVASEGTGAITYTCASPTGCVDARCETLPPVGEACLDGSCREGFCDADECTAFAAAGDACPPGLCGPGLQCSTESICEAQPARLPGPCLGFGCLDQVTACSGS